MPFILKLLERPWDRHSLQLSLESLTRHLSKRSLQLTLKISLAVNRLHFVFLKSYER